jgi:protein DGCR14
MEASSSKALARRSNDTQIMGPPTKRIKRPKNVIEEEDYTSAISEIIARDFFPGLLESETKQEYLDALESHDRAWISSASRRLNQVMTPGRQSGRRGTSIKTPMHKGTSESFIPDLGMEKATSVTNSEAQNDNTQIDTNMSLSSFQARYTSEDNESFYKLLDKQNKTKADKYAWMWRGNRLPSKMAIKQKEIENKLLTSGKSLVDDGGRRDRLAIKDVDEKPAMSDGWNAKPNNGFMYQPEGIEDHVETVAQKSQAASRAEPKGVAYDNTRMPVPAATTDASDPPSPTLSAVRAAVAGHQRGYAESSIAGSETPRVNGYAFVDDEPEPEPENPTLASNPIDLGPVDSTPNPFRIKKQSAREDLHHRMVDRMAKAKRTSKLIGMEGGISMSPMPKFPNSPRINAGGLTPAAQRLWSRVGGAISGATKTPSRSYVASRPL